MPDSSADSLALVSEELPEHVRRNRVQWDLWAAEYAEPAQRNWAEELVEIRPPDGSTTRYPFMTLEWARRWPCEEIWKARKRRQR